MNDQVYGYIYERFIKLNKEFRGKLHTWKPAPERGEFSILIETETDVFEFLYKGTNNCMLIPLYKKEIDKDVSTIVKERRHEECNT